MIDEMGLATELTKIATQLEAMADGASFVADGHVRVRDPAYLIEKLKASAAAIERLVAENRALTEALTPSGDTKAAYIGEFRFDVEVWDPDGGEDGEGEVIMESKTVPWTTVKEIMAAISARARQALGDT